jgi:hypothetical protein
LQHIVKVRKEEGEEGDQGLAEALADSDDERVSARRRIEVDKVWMTLSRCSKVS